MVYYETPDMTGHQFGPRSPQIPYSVRVLDTMVTNLMKMIGERRLEDEVNFVLLSDHGMLDIEPGVNAEYINLEDHFDLRDAKYILGGGSTVDLHPVDNKEGKIYRSLTKNGKIKGMNVYRKKDIPEKYHLKNNLRTPPILLVAEKGYFIRERRSPSVHGEHWGSHGYDPFEVTEMRTIFLGKGPGFKRGFVSEPLMQTDHYNVFCRLIGVNPNPNNGSIERVTGMLVDPPIVREDLF